MIFVVTHEQFGFDCDANTYIGSCYVSKRTSLVASKRLATQGDSLAEVRAALDSMVEITIMHWMRELA